MNQHRVLFVASEVTPLIKVGGLADVVGALPDALAPLGVEARICIPRYGALSSAAMGGTKNVLSTTIPWKGRSIDISLLEGRLPNSHVTVYYMDAPEMFLAGGVYYEHDTEHGTRLAMERFVFFSWAVAHCIPQLPWQPDVVHCHDWHAAAVPAMLTVLGEQRHTVLTIHNIEGQGKWNAAEALQWLGLPTSTHATLQPRDLQGNLNILQLGICTASVVNTVSPTYAQELLTPQYGQGLEGDLARRPGGVRGIVNGIDTALFNPETDTQLPARYAQDTVAAGKLINKRSVLAECSLTTGSGPLFVVVGRLTQQKGVDLLPGIIPDIMHHDGRLIILGSGVPDIEQAITSAIAPYPTFCRAFVKFDAALASRLYGAADFFLMPSRFEPCGLGQLLAMRYGALPIVRDTGGLHDTVRDIRRHKDGTGFVFTEPTTEALRAALQDALRVFNQHDTMTAARQRAMRYDCSWSRSASTYVTLYSHA